jgi:hypothetical protein
MFFVEQYPLVAILVVTFPFLFLFSEGLRNGDEMFN